MHHQSIKRLLLLALCAWVGNAHAYLDPNSGSILLQLILGGVAGAMVAGKLFWHRVRAFFSFNKSDPGASKVSGENPPD